MDLRDGGSLKELRGAEVWRGRQWVVTTHGMQSFERIKLADGVERFQPRYSIQASRLRSGLVGKFEPWWSPLVDLAGNGWVDLEDFTTAFLIACVFHGVKSEHIAAAIEEARRVRCRTDEVWRERREHGEALEVEQAIERDAVQS